MDKIKRKLLESLSRKAALKGFRPLLKIFINILGKPSLPEGVTSKELVIQAIEFKNPKRVPYSFNTQASDICTVFNIETMKGMKKPKVIGETYKDPWGITMEYTGKLWDHAVDSPFKAIDDIEQLALPEFNFSKPSWFTRKLIKMGKKRNKYILGVNSINLFEQLRSLLGFEEHMMAPYTKPDFLKGIINQLVEMTIELIDSYQMNGGIDGFMTVEDWGLQKGLQIDIEQFRDYYKPAYIRIINHCHDKGIHFFWHCCGDIIELLPEMVEIGVDVVQLDQPLLMGYEAIIKATAGNLCFYNCVDVQWSAIEGRELSEITNETRDMMKIYKEKMPLGGFILKHYSEPEDIGFSREKELCIVAEYFNQTKGDE